MTKGELNDDTKGTSIPLMTRNLRVITIKQRERIIHGGSPMECKHNPFVFIYDFFHITIGFLHGYLHIYVGDLEGLICFLKVMQG